MTLYICCSHLYIPTVLTLYEKLGEDACFYTDKTNIVEMFKYLRKDMEVYCPRRKKRGVFSLLKDNKEKKELKEWLKHKDVNKVYFFHEGYCEVANWMMLFLSNKGHVEFHYLPIARSYSLNHIDQEKGFRAKLRALYCKMEWGYKPIYPKQDRNCGVMPASFYEKLRITKEEAIEANKEIGKTILTDEFDENGIVLLDNPNLTDSESERKYIDLLESALRPIMNDCPIYFKNHPGRTQKIGLENEIKEIPSFISGNLLTRRFRAFVGVNSALLCEAANDGTKAICLVYLVDLDEDVRMHIIEYHKMLSGNIIFPNTIQEFEKIFSNSCVNRKEIKN